jgi:hypothetical protein
VTERLLVWRGVEEWLAESCRVTLDGRFVASGVQLGAEPHPYRIDYVLITGSDWVTERLHVQARDADGLRSLDLIRDADGSWTADGEPLPDVQGALDCDLEFSPVTNYMPARRLGRKPVDHLMAFVHVPSLVVRPSRQRYEPIDEHHVRYVSLDGDFVSELELDDDGLAVRYPRLAELVPSGARAEHSATT